MNPGKAGLVFHEPLLFELGGQNKRGVELPEMDLPIISDEELLGGNLRQSPNLPELSEPEVVRHFTRLSQWNYSLDGGFYPLGSCTMKYNPKINEDIAVPRSLIPDMMEQIQKISDKYNTQIVCFGHAGDGNIHVNIMTDENNGLAMEKAKAAIKKIFQTTIKMRGTLSGEHGIGNVKSAFIDMELGQKEIEIMKSIKKVFDPNNILNPHKIFQ